ncbi:MAG: SRPBCC family protein [Actinobacteria bacterium]|nr:SRPBCC family protein [Actinomycetota bacterium]
MNPTTITAQPGTPFLEVVREFDATPTEVYRAATDPELVVQWLGPRSVTMTLEQWDVRDGGGYRYIHSRDDFTVGFRGVYHTVRPNELVISTFEFEGAPDQVAVETARYEDLGDGRTRLVMRSVFPSVEALESALQMGMTGGVEESMERLAELLAR